MNKLKPRYKICFHNNENIYKNLKISTLKKKKWNLLKKNLLNPKTSIKKKPEEKKKLFKERLYIKQKFKFFYGCIPEYKLKNIFNQLKKNKNQQNILENLIILLESRIDIVLFRLKIVKSIFHAQQLISHGKIKINNKTINSKNYFLKKGDIFIIQNNKSSNLNFKIKNKVNYLEFNNLLKMGIFLRKPLIKEIEYPFQINLKIISEALYKK